MTNAFENYADDSKPHWLKKRERANGRRAATIKAKRESDGIRDEQNILEKGYHAWKHQQHEDILAGPFGREVKGLETFLRTMTASSAPALVQFVERAAWVQSAPENVKLHVIELCWRAIRRVRTKEGEDPDDMHALWGEEPRAADLVHAIVLDRDPYFGGVAPREGRP